MVAWLTRAFGPAHVQLAEEVVQDALVKALQQWPHTGVPDNPSAWLMRVARNGAIDVLRRHKAFRERARDVEASLARPPGSRPLDGAAGAVGDDELRMIFMCCHPSLTPETRVALSLQLACGFNAREIGRALLTAEPAIAQRLVRAKRTLRDSGVSLDMPDKHDLQARLASVLEVIYLMFNEGYASAGADLIREDLCREALRLGRALAANPLTATPATHALVALIALQSSRLAARLDDAGNLVRLEEQDRSRWDQRLVALGFHHFAAASTGDAMSPYHPQAAIAALHAGAESAADTPWPAILARYDELMALAPSSVVALNRAIAVARVHGAPAALDALAPLEDAPELHRYHLYWSTRAQLLEEAGDVTRARDCYARAHSCPCSEAERRFLQGRAERTAAARHTIQ